MAKTLGTGAAQLNLRFQIGSARTITFDFGTDLSAWTFEFVLKQNKGARVKDISLTIGSGISMPIYGTDSIDITFTSTNTSITEGEYYWELRRTDLNVPLINGLAYFSYDAPDGDDSIPLEFTIGSNTINVTVSGTSSGSGTVQPGTLVLSTSEWDLSLSIVPQTGGTGSGGSIERGNLFYVRTGSDGITVKGPDGGPVISGFMALSLATPPGTNLADRTKWALIPTIV